MTNFFVSMGKNVQFWAMAGDSEFLAFLAWPIGEKMTLAIFVGLILFSYLAYTNNKIVPQPLVFCLLFRLFSSKGAIRTSLVKSLIEDLMLRERDNDRYYLPIDSAAKSLVKIVPSQLIFCLLEAGQNHQAAISVWEKEYPGVTEKVKYLVEKKWAAISTLVEASAALGTQAIPTLVQALADGNRDVRSSAAYALGRIGPPASEAIPALLQALADGDMLARRVAAKALGRIGPQTSQVIPALVQALAVRDGCACDGNNVCSAAAYALGRIGPPASEAIPALIKVLRGIACCYAADALSKIGPQAIPALVQALADINYVVRYSAAEALGMIGPPASEAIPALTKALRDRNNDVCMCAAKALGRMGPAAKQAIPALKKSLGRHFSNEMYTVVHCALDEISL